MPKTHQSALSLKHGHVVPYQYAINHVNNSMQAWQNGWNHLSLSSTNISL